MKTKISLFGLVLTLAALACNLPTEKLGTITPGAPQTARPSLPTAEITYATALTEKDACKLFNEVQASTILGEAVIPPTPANSPGYSVCTFFTSTMKKGIYITITMGDQAKKNLLNEISQYQKGCSVGYSGGTNTATPFPPEVEALMSKTVLELYQMNIQMQGKCGIKIEPLPEFGPNAYAYLNPVALPMGTVAIVSGDNIYAFSYADSGLNIAQMVEKAKEVTRAVISPTPVGSPTQSGVPTPISSPTLVEGSGLVSGCPTPIGGGPTPVSCSVSAEGSGCPTQIGGGPTPVSCSASVNDPTPVSGPTQVPTPVGKPTKIGKPTPVDIPTSVGPSPVGPTSVGPTPIGPTPIP